MTEFQRNGSEMIEMTTVAAAAVTRGAGGAAVTVAAAAAVVTAHRGLAMAAAATETEPNADVHTTASLTDTASHPETGSAKAIRWKSGCLRTCVIEVRGDLAS